MKAKFSEKQRPVSIYNWGEDKESIFICLNETEVEETVEGMTDENGESVAATTVTVYEYDFREILETKGYIDHEDLLANPESYLDYVEYKEKSIEERAEQLEGRVDELTEQNGYLEECILELSEILFS